LRTIYHKQSGHNGKSNSISYMLAPMVQRSVAISASVGPQRITRNDKTPTSDSQLAGNELTIENFMVTGLRAPLRLWYE
jgi:hypothetical protein